ncbi:MAG: acyl-CoA dehydrogenase family protein [Leucobacter sp.]
MSDNFTAELKALPTPDLSKTALKDLTNDLKVGAAQADQNAELSQSGIQAAFEAGLLTLPISGLGSDMSASNTPAVDFARAFVALGAGDPSVALVALMTVSQHVVAMRRRDWPEELHREILGEAANRPVLLNAARAEPGLGSAARGGSPETTMRRTSNGWVLNGRKRFVTGAEHLDYHVVWALDPDSGETGRLIVPGIAPGVEAVPAGGMIGMRASSTHDVIYADVELTDAYRCIPTGANLVGLAPEFELGIAALYLGIAQSARDALTRFLTTRSPSGLGTPLAEIDRIQLEVGLMEARLIEAEAVLFSHARLIDEQQPGATPDPRLAATKHLCTTAAIDIVERAVRVGGGFALAERGDLARHLRDVLCARPHPPQEDVTLRTLGRSALGQSS